MLLEFVTLVDLFPALIDKFNTLPGWNMLELAGDSTRRPYSLAAFCCYCARTMQQKNNRNKHR